MQYQVSSFLETSGSLVPIAEVLRAPPDADYIEGAILWSIEGQQILTFSHRDLIDQLWSYLINALESLSNNQVFETCFPDQPLLLRLESVHNNLVAVTIGDTTFTLSRRLVFKSLLQGARDFFSNMLRLLPKFEITWREQLDKVSALDQECRIY